MFNGKLPPGWTCAVVPDPGPEPHYQIWDANGVHVCDGKLDVLRPILFTETDHLLYFWRRWREQYGYTEAMKAAGYG